MSSTLPINLPNGNVSALIGQPPATEDDYYFVSFLLSSFGIKTNPMLGAQLPPARPADYVFETRGPGIVASCTVSIVVMVTVTALRLAVRLFGKRLKFGWDDWVLIPGVLLAISWPTLQLLTVKHGAAGKHMYDITYWEYNFTRAVGNTTRMLFYLSLSLIKISICIFNKRLTYLTSRFWSIYNNSFLCFLVIYFFLVLFLNIFRCNSAYSAWDGIRFTRERGVQSEPPTCVSFLIIGVLLSNLHVVTDFGLLACPIIVLWKVKIGWKTRIRLYFVFSVGGISCVGSVMTQVVQGRLGTDMYWNTKQMVNWSLVDITFGVVAASLPVLSAFLPKSWSSVISSHSLGNVQDHSPDVSRQSPNTRLSSIPAFSASPSAQTSTNAQHFRVEAMHSGIRENFERNGKSKIIIRSISEENFIESDEVALRYQRNGYGDLESS